MSQGVIAYSVPYHGTIAARRSRRKTTYAQLQEPNYIATCSQLWMLRTTTNITIDSPLVTLPSGAHSDNLLTKSLKTQKRTTRGPKKPKSIKSFASLEKNFEFMKDRVRDPNNEPRSLWCQVGHRGSQTSQHSTILASRLSPRPLQMDSKRNGEIY